MTESSTPARLRQRPFDLVRQAAGGPREMAAKLGRLGQALWAYADGRELDARLERLKELGYIDRVPNRVQLIVGARDMLRFWIVPAAADYYEAKGIDFTFHQILRFLDEPASMVDPTGFLSSRDNIIGHLMQVVHANPAYDLQLLESHEEGLDQLERQVEQMLAGTHPRARSIGAIVEDPDYHARLLSYVRQFRVDRDAEAPLRENVSANQELSLIERTFGTLPGAMRYFAALPGDLRGAVRHLRTVQSFPVELARRAAARPN